MNPQAWFKKLERGRFFSLERLDVRAIRTRLLCIMEYFITGFADKFFRFYFKGVGKSPIHPGDFEIPIMNRNHIGNGVKGCPPFLSRMLYLFFRPLVLSYVSNRYEVSGLTFPLRFNHAHFCYGFFRTPMDKFDLSCFTYDHRESERFSKEFFSLAVKKVFRRRVDKTHNSILVHDEDAVGASNYNLAQVSFAGFQPLLCSLAFGDLFFQVFIGFRKLCSPFFDPQFQFSMRLF